MCRLEVIYPGRLSGRTAPKNTLFLHRAPTLHTARPKYIPVVCEKRFLGTYVDSKQACLGSCGGHLLLNLRVVQILSSIVDDDGSRSVFAKLHRPRYIML